MNAYIRTFMHEYIQHTIHSYLATTRWFKQTHTVICSVHVYVYIHVCTEISVGLNFHGFVNCRKLSESSK